MYYKHPVELCRRQVAMQHWSSGEGSEWRCDMNVFYLEEVEEALRTEDMDWGQSTEWRERRGLGHTPEKGPRLRGWLRMRNWEEDGDKSSQKGWRKSRSSGYQGIMKDHVPRMEWSAVSNRKSSDERFPIGLNSRCLWGPRQRQGWDVREKSWLLTWEQDQRSSTHISYIGDGGTSQLWQNKDQEPVTLNPWPKHFRYCSQQ